MKATGQIFIDFKSVLLLFLCMTVSLSSSAQDTTNVAKTVTQIPVAYYSLPRKSLLDFPGQLNKKRLIGVSVGAVGTYSAIMTGVAIEWYGKNNRTKFHWFNDAKEWNQVDKIGHFYVPYFITTATYNMLRWSGVKNTPAALAAGAFGFLSLSAIEIPDGMSPKYGASWSDLVFNFGGAALATTQYLLWKEQRITIKYNLTAVDYPRGELRDRANELYGSSFTEKILKDYNGITVWASINLHSFNHAIKPAWLNVAIGYGAGNMYGGFDNTWTDKNGVYHNRNDIKRYRKFLISIDADYTKFKTNSKAGKMILGILNIVKLPMPALEFNTLGQVVFHPMYFLNLDVPLYLRK